MDWNGLAAECSDLMGGDDPGQDCEYYRRILQRQGGAALDVGCGTGRLLVCYLRDGLHVEGVDTARDSLAICRRKAEAQGFSPVLYQQAMQSLELPRRYRTIFIPCGSFQLLSDHAEAQEALRRFHRHLEPEGMLVISLFEPTWDDMTDEGVGKRPGPWWTLGEAIRPSDGARLVAYWMKESLDRVEQLLVNQRRYEAWLDDRLIQEEHRTMKLRWYYQHEVRLMLESAGFRDIRIQGDYRDEDVTPKHEMWIFHATK